jgi:hypothetical protein
MDGGRVLMAAAITAGPATAAMAATICVACALPGSSRSGSRRCGERRAPAQRVARPGLAERHRPAGRRSAQPPPALAAAHLAAGLRIQRPADGIQIGPICAIVSCRNATSVAAQNGGYRVSHDHGAVTVGNETHVWQDRCLGQSRLPPPGPRRRSAAQRRHRRLPGLTRTVTLVWGW